MFFVDLVDILVPFFMVTITGFEEDFALLTGEEGTQMSLIEFSQLSGLRVEDEGNTGVSSAIYHLTIFCIRGISGDS